MNLKLVAILAVLTLSACAESKWATDEAVAAARYVAPAPRSITLYSVVATRNGSGAHSGLLVNASEQVMFDPAGTWYHPHLPERNDVHFGITPTMIDFYIDYHARVTYDVIEQTVVVPPEVAEMVLERVKAYGAVPKAQCSNSVSNILAGVPGFESIGPTLWPNRLSKEFGKIPGATYQRYTDDDADDNHGVLLVQAGQPAQ